MSRQKLEFGDFQTPPELANQVVDLICDRSFVPRTVLEPTCGKGELLYAAVSRLSGVGQAIGVEINPEYLAATKRRLSDVEVDTRLIEADFFKCEWSRILADAEEPWLIIGNPPWVTNSILGSIGSKNLPAKANESRARGIDALTGSSNFDVSESVIWQMMEFLRTRRGMLAMLCKSSVARRVLKRGWMAEFKFDDLEILNIDAHQHFEAAVDACLFVVSHFGGPSKRDCNVRSLGDARVTSTIGWRDNRLIADVDRYERSRAYYQTTSAGQRANGIVDADSAERFASMKWRSGVKHDCAGVMELHEREGQIINGLGEPVDVESPYLLPLVKSSALLKGRPTPDGRWMLITQRRIGDDTAEIERRAPRVWQYLQGYGDRLDRRASRIYEGRPRFSMFGIGDYTFQPWKVAISGFDKQVRFHLVGPHQDKPVVFDDTCYFLSFDRESAARQVWQALNSEPVAAAFEALIFFDAKRPITAAILNQVNPLATSH